MKVNSLLRVHWSFWLIGIVMLIWNAMGAMNFFMQMNPEMLSLMPENHRMITESRPLWATAGFALSVFGGVIGCILLLLKKKSAIFLFIASFLGVIGAMAHAVFMAGALSIFSPFEVILAVIMPILVAVFLIWYAKLTLSKNWIG